MKHVMKQSKWAIAIMMLATVAMAGGRAAASTVTGFLSTPTFDSTRNDTLAQVGWGFYVNSGQTTTINRLGFWVSPSDSSSTGALAVDHTVALYKFMSNPTATANYTEIAQATVAAGSTGDANQYAWATIPDLTLTDIGQKGDYYIVTASVGTDVWGPFTGNSYTTTNSSFNSTTTGNGWVISSAAPGTGNTVYLTSGVGGNMASGVNYIGPNIGYAPTPDPATGSLVVVGAGLLLLLGSRRRQTTRFSAA